MNAEKIINGMRSQVQTITHQIEDLNRPRLDNTPKRQREAMGRRFDAANLERIRRTMECLADRWQCGDMPEEFKHLRTRSVIGSLVSKRSESHGYYHLCESDKYQDESELAVRLREFVAAHTDEQYGERDAERAAAVKIAELEEKIRFVKIPGFFPTPAPVIDRMLQAAGIEPGMDVLEPSAGKGDISAAATKAGARVTSVEINHTLCDIIEAKGMQVTRADFLELTPTRMYDRILMNPPFEKGQDVEHVTQALKWLKPGGRLVAIMAPGFQHKGNKASAEFRELLELHAAEVEDLPAGSFESSFNPTSVRTCMVTIDAPEVEELAVGSCTISALSTKSPGVEGDTALIVHNVHLASLRPIKRAMRCSGCKVDLPVGAMVCRGAGPVRCSTCGPICSIKAPTTLPAVDEALEPEPSSEPLKNAESPATPTDKTDRSPDPTLLSALSVPPGQHGQSLEPAASPVAAVESRLGRSLAEQLRPQRLDDIAGQDHVVAMLKTFAANPFPAAFVFSGETGTGKTSAAIALANALGCATEHAEYGGLFQIPAGDQNADQVRQVWERMHFSVFLGSGWKVLLVNEADRMGRPAENIWLDRLESIPPRTVVIFTTNEVDRLAQRFRDRCTAAHFESDALLVAPAAKKWIERIMTEVTGAIPNQTRVDAIFDECVRDGHFSYRRAVFVLQKSLLTGNVRAA